jgi:hypothetical protein
VKVFISWSGEPSRSIARALDAWLESVVQHVDVWMSDEEITSGQRWNEAIAKSLDETDFGIVCLTRANQHAPWLIFEAGAVAKSVEEGRVVPLCIDLPLSDLTGPLVAFQGRLLDETGLKRLIHDLNDTAEKKISSEQLDRVFNAMWPELKAAIDQAIEGAWPTQEPQRSTGEMLAELIDTVRSLERDGVDGNLRLSRILGTVDLLLERDHMRPKDKWRSGGPMYDPVTRMPLGIRSPSGHS